MNNDTSSKVDRSAFSIISLDEQMEEEKQYWQQKTPHERLMAVEKTREILYGKNSTSSRLQRVFEITEQV